MTYTVQITRRAAREIEDHHSWIAERDGEAADRWRERLTAAFAKLRDMPEGHPPAAETEWCPRDIREAYFGRRGSQWRVLFEVQGTVISIVRVRYGRQDLLHPGDL